MNKYLTVKNIVLTVAIIAAIVFFALWLGGNRKPVTNDAAFKILQEQMDSLKAEQKRMKETDSLLSKAHNDTVFIHNKILVEAKEKRDEKIKRINNYNSDSLRKFFDGL